VTVLGGADDAPSNVNIAGQETVQVWAREDASRENAVWLWAAADNLKIAALSAYETARTLAASRPSGKVQ
jgi:aspartate-semialdehyde dehydrogenase